MIATLIRDVFWGPRARSCVFLIASLATTVAIDTSAFASAGDADSQVKALYQAEWSWRAKEFGSPDDDMTSRAHTALSAHEVSREVDRYISWPGQALSYKLGEMTIRRKRAEAEAKLGATFDQRWFNDTILALGAVPLPVLERQLDDWIAAGGKNPNAGSSPAKTGADR